ncbi:MAG: ABC transporter permease [Oligoflexales bacterium]|nr:ABC transporter permease [Oligoflexales bacterium]
MHILSLLQILLVVAMRNLWLNKLKTFVLGSILAFGTFLFEFGLTLLHHIEDSMKRGIVQSVAGHIQVYSKKSKDKLALYGGSFMGKEDLSPMENFEKVSEKLKENPNVAEVVPMGFEMAMLGRGNESDELFLSLRQAVQTKDKHLIQERIEQVQFHLTLLEKELAETKKIVSNSQKVEERLEWLHQAEDKSFLESFLIDQDHEKNLQFLEAKIAPISGEKTPIYLRYLGTDPVLFQKTFKNFKILSGEMMPEGTRGILLSFRFMEDFLKMITARNFDVLYRKKIETGLKIDSDPELVRIKKELAMQHRPLLIELDRQEGLDLELKLSIYLDVKTPVSLEQLLKDFLVLTDENFLSRYEWFYKNIAPLVPLYQIHVGETIVLKSYTKNGYVKSLPVKIYGTYSFEGLERSDLAGQFNITDLETFRELYGQMSDEALKELDSMRQSMNLKEVSREDVESALFGENATVEEHGAQKPSQDFVNPSIKSRGTFKDSYNPENLKRGLFINAAVFLKNEKSSKETQLELEKSLDSIGPANVIDWQQASGIVGQFVEIIRFVLFFGVSVILLVALVIINNSMIVATFERMKEIGTMRAFGSQKSFIMGLFLMEAGLLSVSGAFLGSLFAFITLKGLSVIGIPAVHEVLVFMFSGPRLFPAPEGFYLVLGPFLISLLAMMAALYPAMFAAAIPPAVAMQEKE